MFVGRKKELEVLEGLYASPSFEMVVLYGRRRVGKTALIEKFSQGKNVLFFTAQMQSDKDNLADFSLLAARQFGLPETTPPFASWLDAFGFVAESAQGKPFALVVDEFPYACKGNSALPSTVQVAIDKVFKATSMLLVLCGSNQGFMEDEVLGEKSPLYGRRTAQLKLGPFDYRDAARMMPDCSPEERLSYYASLGGTPYYLEGIDHGKSYIENMIDLFFSPTGRMFDEPMMLMRQELREPTVFNSIMRAIARGANRPNLIADAVGVTQTSVAFYLKTLASLGLVEKRVPLGESERSKKGIYRISDPAFLFWYRFVAPYVSMVEKGLGANIAKRLLKGERRLEYEGHVFERVCLEWVLRQAEKGALPIEPTAVGSWWGTDPIARETCDIDVAALDDIDKKALVGECKWRKDFNESKTLQTLTDRCRLLAGYGAYERYLFTKEPVSKNTREREADTAGLHFVTVAEMYE